MRGIVLLSEASSRALHDDPSWCRSAAGRHVDTHPGAIYDGASHHLPIRRPRRMTSPSTDSKHETLSLRVNGETVRADADPDMPLLWFLRDRLDLKGTKYGCGTGYCGACLVLIDGEPNHACMVPLSRVGERAVETIEGLAERGARPVVDAWVAGQVPQCGYCQPAQIVAATAVLRADDAPTRETIDAAMDGVLCRCGTYQRIRRAIETVAAGGATARPPAVAGSSCARSPRVSCSTTGSASSPTAAPCS